MKVKLLSLIGLVLLLGAYAELTFCDDMAISAAYGTYYNADRFLSGKVTIGSVAGGKKTKPLFPRVSNDDFEAALHNSLQTAHLLSEQTSADYRLEAELIEVKRHPTGSLYVFVVHSKIRYILTDTELQEVVLDEVIDARGTASSRDAFRGTKREKIANERSARVNIRKIVDHLYKFNPIAGKTEYTPDETELRNRFKERGLALTNKEYDTWLKIVPPSLVPVVEVENPDGLRSMFDYYATEFEALEVLEICDCGEVVSPQDNLVTRCRTVTRMNPDSRDDAVNVLEMWQYENGAWYWGYTDHHPLYDCPGL